MESLTTTSYIFTAHCIQRQNGGKKERNNTHKKPDWNQINSLTRNKTAVKKAHSTPTTAICSSSNCFCSTSKIFIAIQSIFFSSEIFFALALALAHSAQRQHENCKSTSMFNKNLNYPVILLQLYREWNITYKV